MEAQVELQITKYGLRALLAEKNSYQINKYEQTIKKIKNIVQRNKGTNELSPVYYGNSPFPSLFITESLSYPPNASDKAIIRTPVTLTATIKLKQ